MVPVLYVLTAKRELLYIHSVVHGVIHRLI